VLAWTALVGIVIANLLEDRNGVLWGYGLPIGHDFHIFYTAARAAADGRLAEVFVPEQLWALAHEYLGVNFATNGLWLYPPHWLLLIAPLALLPYLGAYVAFILATLAAYLASAWRLGLRWRWLFVLAVAPSTVFTIMGGQNGLLTGALLVPGIFLMHSRPHLAGLLFGVLTIKPHLGMLVIVSLVATRAWRTAAVATATALALAALATLAYGVEAWTLPLQQAVPVLTRDVSNVAEYWATGLTSVFPHAALVFGAGVLAWGIQFGTAALAVTATYRVCRQSNDAAQRAAIVSAGTMLTFPYLFFYDLPMVTLAVALYTQSRSLTRLEVPLLAALAVTPVLVITGIPGLAPAVILSAFLQLWWRAEHDALSRKPEAVTRAHTKKALSAVALKERAKSASNDRAPRPVAPSVATSVRWHSALVVAAVVLVYANSLSVPFILDDNATITANPAIRSFSSVLDQQRDTPIAGRPVVGFSFAVNYALGDVSVRGYHAVNVAIHATCALLLLGIVKRTLALPRLARFERRRADLAFAVALIWAVHPLNTEAVNYITQRTESLMALFFLLTLYASIRSVTSRHVAVWQTAAVASCFLGMGCKETMAVAPVMVVLYDRAFLYASFREGFSRRWRIYAGLALSWLLLAYLIALQPRSGSTGFSTTVTTWTYLLNQAVMGARYLRLVFWPDDLVVNYGPPVPLTLADVWPYALPIVVLLLLSTAALRSKPQAGFLGIWVFATLAPASSVVPIATQVGAERRMYLPLMAVAALLVMGAYSLDWLRTRVSRARAALALVIVSLALGAATMARNREYASPLVLAETVLRRWPTDVAHGMVGAELVRAQRDDEAIMHLSEGARSDPTARYNLGVALFNTRRFDEAIHELEILIAQHPLREEVPWSRRLIGQAHAAQRKRPEAIAQFRTVLAMTPQDTLTRSLLIDALLAYGVELGTAGRHDEAIAAFRQGVALDSSNARLRANLATALLDAGDAVAAATEAQHAIALNPAAAVSYDLLGRALALQGRYDDAIAQFHEALRISPSDATIREDLERVLAARRNP
jgi:tetratricopeptide (TPR) repeat protein